MDETDGKILGMTGAIVLLICLAIFLTKIATEKELSKKEECYELITLTITAYSPDPSQTDDTPFEMASGRIAEVSELEQLLFVAVSRDLMRKHNLKYGDTIWIGFLVEDTMHKRMTENMDVFFENKELAKKFGRQTRSVIIEKK